MINDNNLKRTVYPISYWHQYLSAWYFSAFLAISCYRYYIPSYVGICYGRLGYCTSFFIFWSNLFICWGINSYVSHKVVDSEVEVNIYNFVGWSRASGANNRASNQGRRVDSQQVQETEVRWRSDHRWFLGKKTEVRWRSDHRWLSEKETEVRWRSDHRW